MIASLVVAASRSPAADLKRAVTAGLDAGTFAVDIAASRTDHGVSTESRARLVRRSGSWATIEIEIPATRTAGAIRWAYELKNNHLFAYDLNRGAYARRLLGSSGNALVRLASALEGMLPEPAQYVVDPRSLGSFFDRLQGVTTWKSTTSHATRAWVHKSKNGSLRIGFDTRTGRFIDWDLTGSGARIHWTFRYSPASRAPVVTAPAGAVEINELRQPPTAPAYPDHQAAEVVKRSIGFYERALRLRVTVKKDGAKYRVDRIGSSVSQVSAKSRWRYASGHLEVYVGGKLYAGKCRTLHVPTVLATLGAEVEPIALDFLNDTNFAARAAGPDYAATVIGTMLLRGSKLTLLQLSNSAVKLALSLDDRGFIREMDSTSFGGGDRLADTTVAFELSKTPQLATFPKAKVQPLPKL